MFTIQRQLMLPGALVAFIALSSMGFAQSSDCNTAAGAWNTQGCAGCDGCAGHAGGLRHGGYGGEGTFSDHFHKLRADFELVTARNSAWPLPFNCNDRELYYRIWNGHYAHGLAVNHTLTGEYFDSETNELNSAGQSKVAWIMQNSPSNDRMIFVYADQTNATMDQRMQSIKSTVDKWYSHMGRYNIAKSLVHPNRIPATYQAQISQSYEDNQPPPVIPVGSGSSVINAVQGN